MAEVTGPISTLPGARHSVPDGTRCDNHPRRKAVVRVQGETDSFGCEMADLCAECWEKEKAAAREPMVARCDWCRADNQHVSPRRDYEEGMCGPVYYVCKPCIDHDKARLDAELDRYDDW